LKAEGKGVFIVEMKGILNIEKLEFVSIAKDIIEVAFEAEYKCHNSNSSGNKSLAD
jgi:hypothetical protein